MNQLVDMTGQRFGRLTVIGIGGCTKEPSGRSRPLGNVYVIVETKC